MTRMSREFSLVLLGAGILSAGYFVAPSNAEELEKKADDQAAAQVGEDPNQTHHRHRTGGMFLFIHSPGYAAGYGGGRTAAMPGVSRGGFGSAGHSASASS